MNHIGTREIETGRLMLRRIEISDAEEMFACWASDAEVTRFLRWTPHDSVQQTRNIITEWFNRYESPSTYHWGLTLKDGGALIGSIGAFNINEGDMKCELGYCCGRKFWGSGYMSEAARAVVHYMLFDVGIARVEAYHSTQNPASGGVMRNAGMKCEGRCRQFYRNATGVHDVFLYGAVRDDMYQPSAEFAFLDTEGMTDGTVSLKCVEKAPADPARGRVPAYEFEIIAENTVVGDIGLRVGMSDSLYYGGQIGYNIIEEFRGRGYAARACALLAPLAERHGFEKVLITNEARNLASRRVCEKLGAKLIRIAPLPEWHEMNGETRFPGPRRECIWEYNVTVQ